MRAQNEDLASNRRDIYLILRGRKAEYLGTNAGMMIIWVVEKQNKIN